MHISESWFWLGVTHLISLATAALAHGAVIILVTKQMQFCIKIYKNDLCVSGVFWLPGIFYTLRFHNYKSNCTCWQRTTARLTIIGNFNYKIGTMFKHIRTIISSPYTAALRFSLHHLKHQESTSCRLQDKFFVMFRLILPENVQKNNNQMWSISCSFLGRISAGMKQHLKKCNPLEYIDITFTWKFSGNSHWLKKQQK